MPGPLPPGSRVVAYIRDSGGSDQERSAGQQRAVIETYCRDQGLVLLQVYVDASSGGSLDGRAQFQQMVDELRRLAPEPERGRRDPAAPEGVLYWDLKRFARSQDDGAYFRADLRRRGYTLLSLSDDIPGGDLAPVFEAMLSWKAEQDLRDLSKDIKRGHRELLLATGPDGRYLNLWPGKRPTGYRQERYTWGTRRDGKPRTVQRLVPDRGGTWEQVQEAFAMRAAGHSFQEIHVRLGLFANHNSGYSKMFGNHIYAGVLRYGDLEIPDWIERCVDEETWQAVQERKQHAPHPRLGCSDYTLSGRLYCHCGGLLVGSSTTFDGRRYRYYRCEEYSHKRLCQSTVLPADALEQAVYQALAREVLTPERITAMLADAPARDRRTDELVGRVEQARGRLQELDTAIARLVYAVESGGSVPALVETLQKRQRERNQAARRLAEAERQAQAFEHPDITPAVRADFCANLVRVLEAGDVSAIRRLLVGLDCVMEMDEDRQGGGLAFTLPPEVGKLSGRVRFCV